MTGEEIKKERKKQNLTQKELAEKSGISRNALINYEAGTRIPPIDIQLKIANALDLNISDLKDSLQNFHLLKDIIDNDNKINEETTKQIQSVLNAFKRLNIKYEKLNCPQTNNSSLEHKIYLKDKSFILTPKDLINLYNKAQTGFDNSLMLIISTMSEYKN